MNRICRLIPFLMITLITVARAGDRSNGVLFSNHTWATCRQFDTGTSVWLQVDVPNEKNSNRFANIRIEIYTHGYQALHIWGSVPASVFDVSRDELVVNIEDLREFVRNGLNVEPNTYPGPIPLRFTMRVTAGWVRRLQEVTKQNEVQPDGTTILKIYNGRYTDTLASVEGEVAGYNLPPVAEISRGDFKTRFR